jgi:hypothetical protein
MHGEQSVGATGRIEAPPLTSMFIWLARSAAGELKPRGRRRFSAALTPPLHGWCLVAVLPLSARSRWDRDAAELGEGIWGVAAESERKTAGVGSRIRKTRSSSGPGPSPATGLRCVCVFLSSEAAQSLVSQVGPQGRRRPWRGRAAQPFPFLSLRTAVWLCLSKTQNETVVWINRTLRTGAL